MLKISWMSNNLMSKVSWMLRSTNLWIFKMKIQIMKTQNRTESRNFICAMRCVEMRTMRAWIHGHLMKFPFWKGSI